MTVQCLSHRLYLPVGHGRWCHCWVTNFSFLCALWHPGSSAVGPRAGSSQQPRDRQRLDVSQSWQEPLDWGKRTNIVDVGHWSLEYLQERWIFNGGLFLYKQINMQKKMRLTGIITQGASRMGAAEYIKAFKVASSLDGKVYTTFRVEGQWRDKVRKVCFHDVKKQLTLHSVAVLEIGPGLESGLKRTFSRSRSRTLRPGGLIAVLILFGLVHFLVSFEWSCLQHYHLSPKLCLMSMCCRFSLETQITTAQRPTYLTLPSLPSSSASSLPFAAGHARCVWSWLDVNSMVNTQVSAVWFQHLLNIKISRKKSVWGIHFCTAFFKFVCDSQTCKRVEQCFSTLFMATALFLLWKKSQSITRLDFLA